MKSTGLQYGDWESRLQLKRKTVKQRKGKVQKKKIIN
jgi:hypothetical protein